MRRPVPHRTARGATLREQQDPGHDQGPAVLLDTGALDITKAGFTRVTSQDDPLEAQG